MTGKYEEFIIKQAVNFDTLPWNRKERNFVLFWPVLIWIMFLAGFYAVIFKADETDVSFKIITISVLSLGTPSLYFAFKNYIWPLVFIPVVWSGVALYQIYHGIAEHAWLPLLLSSLFVTPIQVEIYRRKHGLSRPKDIKKDLIIGLGLALVFPAIWGLSRLWLG